MFHETNFDITAEKQYFSLIARVFYLFIYRHPVLRLSRYELFSFSMEDKNLSYTTVWFLSKRTLGLCGLAVRDEDARALYRMRRQLVYAEGNCS